MCKNKIVRLIGKPTAPHFDIGGHRTQAVKPPLRLLPFVLAAISVALFVPFLIMNAVRTDERIAEWWTMNIARGWEKFAGSLTSWLPVSFFELCVVALIIAGVYLFVRLVINLCNAEFKKILPGVFAITLGGVAVLDLYMMSMGFGYYRAAMPVYQSGDDYTLEEVKAVTEYFLADYNALAKKFERDQNGNVICPYTFSELTQKIKDEYSRLDSSYFFEYTPTGKPIVNSRFLSAMNITGITFLPTGEANLNMEAPATSSVVTLVHELAHTKGVQREGDANVIARYVLLTSSDDYLRYCGYYTAFYHLASAIELAGDKDGYYAVLSRVYPAVYEEKRYQTNYWASQPNIPRKIGEMFNNIYLMFNGADNGTGSYNDGIISGTVTPIDPNTGEPEVNPDTGELVELPVYSVVQKTFFYIYEQETNNG